MLNDICFGTYVRFSTPSREKGAVLLGSDNFIGDIYSLETVPSEEGGYTTWLVNRFGAKVATLDPSFVYKVQTFEARGWTLRALLSFVAYDQEAEQYWGEVALLFNDPHYDDAFEPFALALREKMADGFRPEVDYTEQAAREIINSKGTWFPTGRVDMPKLESHNVVVRHRRSASDRLVEAGRERNPGCMVATYVIWAALAVVVIGGILKFIGVW